MPYCSQCGVEVEPWAVNCPLCRTPIQHQAGPPAPTPRYPEIPALPGRQVRRLVWMMSTAALLSAALTCITIDLLPDQTLSWSRYPITGAGVLWLLLTLIVSVARRPIFVIVGQAIATVGFLFVIDLFDGRLDWFVRLALPVVGVFTSASTVVWLVGRLWRAPALTAATVLLAAAAAAVALDLLASAQFGPAHMSWSYIVMGAVLPPAIFLLYFHFRLRRKIDLSRLLHT